MALLDSKNTQAATDALFTALQEGFHHVCHFFIQQGVSVDCRDQHVREFAPHWQLTDRRSLGLDTTASCSRERE